MDPFLHWTLALALAALFGASALAKLRTYNEWPGVVRNFRLLPDRLAGAAAATLLGAELLTAAALVWAPTQPAGAWAAASLLVLTAGAVGINIRRGRIDIDCGCFGSQLRQRLAPWMVSRNVALACFALTLLLPVSERSMSAFEWLVSIGCVLTLAFLYPVAAVVLGEAGPSGPKRTLMADAAPREL